MQPPAASRDDSITNALTIDVEDYFQVSAFAPYIRRDRLEAVAPTGIGAYSGELPHLPGEIKYHGAASRREYGTRSAGLIACAAITEHHSSRVPMMARTSVWPMRGVWNCWPHHG